MANNKTITLSASRIRTYLSCSKKYWFKYMEHLNPPDSDALAIGKAYHEEIANILMGVGEPISPMGFAFKKYIDTSDWKILSVEEHFNISLSRGVRLQGYTDGRVQKKSTGRKYLLEHKTTGGPIDDLYEENLKWDMQIPIYCKATEIYDVLYSVVKKPTIKQKKGSKNIAPETDEEYFQRCIDWYDTDTESKIRLFEFKRLKSEVKEATADLSDLAKEMRGRKKFYRDNTVCKMSACPFKSICLRYNPKCIVGFTKGK